MNAIFHSTVSSAAAAGLVGLAEDSIAAAPPRHKIFDIVKRGNYVEAARIAVRAINNGGGRVPGREFFIYSDHPDYDGEVQWLDDLVKEGAERKFIEFFKITPVRAQVLLERNEGNRRLRYKTFTERLTDIANRRWQVNGETLIVSDDGKLNDGQNRLFSVLLSGATIETAIAFGVERDSIKTVDSGAAREVSDRLGFDGVENPNAKAATASLALKVLEGRAATKADIEEYYNVNRSIIDQVHDATPTIVRGGSDAAFRVAALYLFRRGYPYGSVSTFIGDVRRGDKSRARGCPAWSLREGITSGVRLSREQWVATIAHHYLLWQSGKQCGSLQKTAILGRLP